MRSSKVRRSSCLPREAADWRRHVFGHGLGGAAALYLVSLVQNMPPQPGAVMSNGTVASSADTRPRIASLTLASPYGSLDDLRPLQRRRLQGLDDLLPLTSRAETRDVDRRAAVTEALC